MNKTSLIPDALKARSYYSYTCTWSAQNDAIGKQTFGFTGHEPAARMLTERALFGEGGWAHTWIPTARAGSLLVLDVGWDLEAELRFTNKNWLLGSMEVAQDKFPSCAGTPVERLKKLNALVREAGWAGTGLWVSANGRGDGENGKHFDEPSGRAYWTERARWCSEAGILYWKVDYGEHGMSAEWRRWLGEVVHAVAPELRLEHAGCGSPFNDQPCPYDACVTHAIGQMRTWDDGARVARWSAIARHSDVFRTYDVSTQLAVATALDRAGELLLALSGDQTVRTIINVESEPAMAAGLGCALGYMIRLGTSPARAAEQRAAIRTLRWERLASPFSAGACPARVSPDRLEDVHVFKPGDSWTDWLNGHAVRQSAPARMSRGMALPEVKPLAPETEAPFVVASRQPETGAVAVAALPRMLSREHRTPAAEIALTLPKRADGRHVIGVFGAPGSLRLVCDQPVASAQLCGQDLLSDAAQTLETGWRIEGGAVVIDGALLRALCADAAEHPGFAGVVLALQCG